MAYVDAVKSLAPFLYYPLNDASGLPKDASGNGRHAISVTGTLTYQQASPRAGTTAKCISMSGSQSIRPHEGTLWSGRTFSLSLWCTLSELTDVTNTGSPLIGQTSTSGSEGTAFLLFAYNSSFSAQAKNGATGVLSISNGPVAGQNLLINTPYHVACSSTPESAGIWVNGVKGTYKAWTGTPSTLTNSHLIGDAVDTYWGQHRGLMSDVATWNRALTDDEVRFLYREGLRDGVSY